MSELGTTPQARPKTAPPPSPTNAAADHSTTSSAGVVITHEDVDRAHDRERVSAMRARPGLWPRARLLWLLFGPGILVMLGENDGPSMLSYASTGARFGIGFFCLSWCSPLPWPASSRK